MMMMMMKKGEAVDVVVLREPSSRRILPFFSIAIIFVLPSVSIIESAFHNQINLPPLEWNKTLLMTRNGG
jgi:hypothetical protein